MHTTVLRQRNTLVLAIFMFLSISAVQAEAASQTLIVPTDFSTIQAAIDQAATLNSQNTGTTYDVLVEPGDWTGGGITLKTGVSVRGRETKETFLSGGTTIMSATGISNVIVSHFTFRNATTGVDISSVSSNVNLYSNVFASNTTAVSVADTSTASIENNVFYQNSTGISRVADNVDIRNNIFSSTVLSAIHISVGSIPTGRISYNFFNPAPAPTNPIGSNSLPNTTITATDPAFVDPANFDFHLKAVSTCIDNGFGTDIVDGSTADMGAYGGPNADTVPAQVINFTASKSGTNAASLSWSKNLDYLITDATFSTGYKIYYGDSKRNYNGTDAAEGASPILAGKATAFSLTSLNRVASAPTTTPTILSIEPRDRGLLVSWTTVSGATSYNITYKEELPGGGFGPTQKVNTGSSQSSYQLTNLTNSVWYDIQVSGVAQAAYYFAVTAYYKDSGTTRGSSFESAYSDEQPLFFGAAAEGPLSLFARGAPDALIPSPNLPNTGCFIATAVYDSADAAPVRILKNFRDRVLAASSPGRVFIAWYYRTSPGLAQKLNEHPALKPLVRLALDPLVAAAFIATAAPTPLLALLLCFLAAAAVLAYRRRRVAAISRS